MATVVDKVITLTVQSTVILFGNGWDPNHSARRAAQQFGHIDVVGLYASRAAINRRARRVDDLLARAILFQQPVDPEPVTTGRIAAHDFDRPLQLSTKRYPRHQRHSPSAKHR